MLIFVCTRSTAMCQNTNTSISLRNAEAVIECPGDLLSLSDPRACTHVCIMYVCMQVCIVAAYATTCLTP